jgi:chaperonin GroES
MEIRPLYDRIIVKRIDQQRQTASGIVIPDTATEKPEQGDVIAVGNGRLLHDGSVLFGKYAGQTVKIDDQELLVLKEEDVLGILEEPPTASLKKVA